MYAVGEPQKSVVTKSLYFAWVQAAGLLTGLLDVGMLYSEALLAEPVRKRCNFFQKVSLTNS